MPRSASELLAFKEKTDRLFANLTTPSEIDEQVAQFAKSLSDKEPVFLDCAPLPWSRQSCCDANVAKYIEEHGGKMLSGYRIWYNEPLYIEGERHAIWTDGQALRDVSFVDTGETRILFVPDDKAFDDAPLKVRHAFEPEDRVTLARHESVEQMMIGGRMSREEAWKVMPSYEDWLQGKRMPNLVPSAR